MASLRLFKGLAHDIAQHAYSAYSCLYPHLPESCQKNGVSSVTLNLVGQPYRNEFEISRSLYLATNALQKTFITFMNKMKLDLDLVDRATLTFFYPPEGDRSAPDIAAQIVLKTGKQYSYNIGRPII